MTELNLTYDEVLAALQGIEQLDKAVDGKIKPVKLAIKLGKVKHAFKNARVVFDEQKETITKEHTDINDDGKVDFKDQEAKDTMIKELKELLDASTDFRLPEIKTTEFDSDYFGKIGLPADFFDLFMPVFADAE